MSDREIRVRVARHVKTGVLMATSNDLPGLMVGAVDDQELRRLLPIVITDLLTAHGERVVSVLTEPETDHLPPGFTTGNLIASAKIAA